MTERTGGGTMQQKESAARQALRKKRARKRAIRLAGAAALAEGNVTIAVQGMNDFSDYIQSMIVYGDKLLLSSWDTLYTWDNTSRKLTLVDGYDLSLIHI